VADFCEHCQGQRFDRAQVLRTLRKLRGDLRARGPNRAATEALTSALIAVRALEIPHLEVMDDEEEDQVVH
jgi:hypothetical protein